MPLILLFGIESISCFSGFSLSAMNSEYHCLSSFILDCKSPDFVTDWSVEEDSDIAYLCLKDIARVLD
jgi:hypothetical protein